MENFWRKLKVVFTDPSLRKKILFIFFALIIFRIFAAIPIPGVDAARLSGFLADNQFLGILNVFSGGGLSSLSIIMLGIGPFITASIVMQLLTIMVPKLKALYQEEGEIGRKKFTQYSRLLTVPLALVQGFGLMTLLTRQGIISNLTSFEQITNLIVITAGSVLLMWIGELISEYGIGNGVSILIFAGIIASLPAQINQLVFTFDTAQIPLYLTFLVAAILIVLGIIVVTEAERPIPVTYAKQVRGAKMYGGVSTYIPLRLNQAGVMPIIFALSLLLFPQMISTVLLGINNVFLQKIGGFLEIFAQTAWLYALAYFVLVFAFTYFYTAITFDPEALSKNLQKSGAFIPGIRPGASTSEYINKILTRITFVGAFFLGVVAVLPLIMQSITGITALAIGGTGLLIVVSVVLDIVKKVEAQISMREY
ncbi:preprotein translocase subunit SecY [Candidatus Wolfebacteria bacterium]|nr:MAG: preprotein translocase subunit SecY [Candidatus Wolfebacteria bacterium]